MPIFLFFPSPATIPPSAPPAGLFGHPSFVVSYWSLDNIDIGSVLDVIGLNDGTNINALTGKIGQVNQAYEFDGYSSHLSFPSDLSFESHIGRSGGLSFSAWVRPATVAVTQTLFSKFDTTNDERAFRFQLHADGYIQLEVSDRTGANCVTVCSAAAIPSGQWSQVGFIFNNRESLNTDKITLIINGFIDIGQVVGSSGTWIEMGSTDTSVILGAENSDLLTNFYNGLMDEVVIWCGAISAITMASAHARASDGYRFIDSLPDPTSYWTLDDIDLSGTIVLDAIGTNDGVNNSATTSLSGIVNEAFQFDGASSSITVADDISLDPELEDYAGACWFKSDIVPVSAQMLITKRGGGGAFDNFALYIRGTGALTIEASDSTGGTPFVLIENPDPIKAGAWYHAFFRIDRTNGILELYQDGYRVGITDLGLLGSFENATELQIGKEGAGNFFDGLIDEVAIWKGVIPDGYGSDLGAKTLYNYGVPNIPPPISYWTMDDNDIIDSTLSDRMRRSDGTITNAIDGYAGQINQAMFFNGANAYITAANESLFDFDLTDPFSISFWINTTDNNAGVITKQDFQVTAGWQVFLRPSGTLILNLGNASVTLGRRVETTSTFNDGTWHHAIVTYDGSDSAAGITWYVDGAPAAMTTVSDTAPGSILNNDNVQIGQILDTGAASRFLNGLMDDIAIWNFQLTQRQIEWIYSEGAKGRTIHTLCDPDGYQLSESIFALVNSTISFGNFEDAINIVNADAGGRFPLPIAYWSMDNSDTIGTTLIDSVGGNNAIVSGGSPTSTIGQVQQGIDFDGSTDYFTVPDSSPFNFDTDDSFSISLWLNILSSTGTNNVIGKFDTAVEPGWVISVRSTGTAILNIIDSSDIGYRSETSLPIDDGIWHNIVAVYDGTDANGITMYVDGVSGSNIVDNTDPGAITGSTALHIGTILSSSSPLNHYDGIMDEIAIWDQKLSSSQVLEIYSLGATNQKIVI